MGGASSDAASALMCAAGLCGLDEKSEDLHEIGARIGSDVPFFLGPMSDHQSSDGLDSQVFAARAQGRGTLITPVSIGFQPHLVVVFPGVSLSTAKVYGESQVPNDPISADQFLNAWKRGSAIFRSATDEPFDGTSEETFSSN